MGRRRPAAALGLLFLAGAALLGQEPTRIGSITVRTVDVFSPEEAARGWVYRAADALHGTTNESVIRRFLLFEEGDPYDPDVLAETERNLRALRFLKSVQVVAGPPHDGVVDVEVLTQDAWTLQLGLSIGSVAGKLIGGVSLGELSLLGSGRQVAVAFGQDTQRTRRLVELRDPALFAPYGTGYFRYAINSDGGEKILDYQRPFYSVTTPWALGLTLRDVQERDAIYADGAEATVYAHRIRNFGAGYAIALAATRQGALRLGVGLDWRQDDFTAYAGHAGDPRPADRNFRYAYVQAEAVGNDYVKLDYVDRDFQLQDFSLGGRLVARFGVSPVAFGAPETTEMASLSWSAGWRIGAKGLLLADASGQTRIEGDRLANAILAGRLLFIHRFATFLPQTFVARLEAVRGFALDPDVQFFADGTTGLRAYRLYAFEGDKRIQLNFEHRIFSGQEVLQLVSPGVAIFADAAAIAPRGEPLRLSSVRTDAGVGLRFAITRASSVPIVRVDFGYAFQPDARGRHGWLISFSGGQAF